MGNKQEDIYTSLDPRMKLLMLILFTTATYISQSTWVLLWDYIIIVALYMIRRLWRGAWRNIVWELFDIGISHQFYPP